jgi:outer membrane protein assembly factor BamA
LPNVESVFAGSAAQGLFEEPDFLHYSGGVWLELRDEPKNPHRGVSLGVALSRFDDRNGSAYEFTRFVVDAREYIPLGSFRHVIALRQTVSADDADEGSTIPFYMRTSLGGGSLLRGFPSSRFRDDRLMLLGSEYRFEATKRVELALICEAGKVFSSSENLEFEGLRSNYGAGIRIKSRRKVHFRLDAVRGSEGMRWHAKLGRSF